MIERLARMALWRWLLAGLAIGVVGVLSVVAWGDPDLSAYGESIDGQRVFETALTEQVAGVPRFTDVRVHALTLTIAPGRRRDVHIVTGLYNDGRPEEAGNAAATATWRPAFFVASLPYRPVTNVAALGGSQVASRFASLPQATVVDFLDLLHDSRGVQYRRAWWRSPNLFVAAWLVVGVIGVGMLCPIVLRIVVFGTWRTPRDPAGLDRTAYSPTEHAEQVASTEPIPDIPLPELLPDATAPPAASPPKRPVTLVSEPVTPATAGNVHETSFGVSPNDFYPTELKVGTPRH